MKANPGGYIPPHEVIFWDEVPLMIYNIKQRRNEDTAMELLNTLRSLRQMHPDLRMVFTGSIGLHNVITSLKRAGYANDPTNDMYTMDVPPLSPLDAQELARRLLGGEDIRTDSLQATAQAIGEAVDGIPHYIGAYRFRFPLIQRWWRLHRGLSS